MKYINLPSAIGQHPSVMQSTPAQIGVWTLLICYCHTQMNGGAIVGAREWSSEMWCRILGVDGSIVAQDSPLWHWTPVILMIHHYDLQAEESYRKKQQMGRVYVERRWAAVRERKIIQIQSGKSGKPQKTITTQTTDNQQLNR